MRLRLLLILFITVSVISIVYIKNYEPKSYDTTLDKIMIYLDDKNSYYITSKDIDLNHISILWYNEVKPNRKFEIYKNGLLKEGVPPYYGKNYFDVYYYDTLINQTGHFKTNNWEINNYYFHIFKDGYNKNVKFAYTSKFFNVDSL